MKTLQRILITVVLLSLCIQMGMAAPLGRAIRRAELFLGQLDNKLQAISPTELTKSLQEIRTFYEQEKREVILRQQDNIPEGANIQICIRYLKELDEQFQRKLQKAQQDVQAIHVMLTRIRKSAAIFNKMKNVGKSVMSEPSDEYLYKRTLNFYTQAILRYQGHVRKQLDQIMSKCNTYHHFFEDLKLQINRLDAPQVTLKMAWNLYFRPASDNGISMIRYFERIALLTEISAEERMQACRKLAIVFQQKKLMKQSIAYFYLYKRAMEKAARRMKAKINLHNDSDLRPIISYIEQQHSSRLSKRIASKTKRQGGRKYKRLSRLSRQGRSFRHRGSRHIILASTVVPLVQIPPAAHLQPTAHETTEQFIIKVRKQVVALKKRGLIRDALRYYQVYRHYMQQAAAQWGTRIAFLQDSEMHDLELMMMEGNMRIAKSHNRKSAKRYTWNW